MDQHSLAKLARNSNIWVRCSVAINPSTPSNLLDELASDPFQEVRARVGCNPSTPLHVLARLANDNVPVVRANVEINPKWASWAARREMGISQTQTKDEGIRVPQPKAKKPTNLAARKPHRPVVSARLRKMDVVGPYEQGSGIQKVKRLKLDDDIDQLVTRLIAICRSGADFLQAEDANRYVYLLHNLSAFKIPAFLRTWMNGKRSTVRTGLLPIHDLRHIIGHWIMSYFGDTNPLMPHFALNAAEFIQRMMRGCWEESPDGLRIESIMEATFEAQHLDFDGEFQREFRRRFNPTTRGVVPRNAEFIWLRKADGQSVSPDYLPPGSVFAFDVTECHLSGTISSPAQITIKNQHGNLTPDICRDFQLHGVIRPLTSSPTIFGQFLEQRGSGQSVRLPFRWITDVVVLNPIGKTASFLPVPTWIEQSTESQSAKKRPKVVNPFR